MQINLKDLNKHLAKGCASLYLISGDVPLLQQEARDLIKAAAKKQGHHQHHLFHVESGFQWQDVHQQVQNFGLFSDKDIIDIRNPSAKFDNSGVDFLKTYLAMPQDDHIVIISLPKLTSAQKKSKWMKACQQALFIPIWPIANYELPQWVQMRLRKFNLQADSAAVQFLIEFTQGNLLATQQAIEKLHLLYPGEKIDTHKMATVVSDNAKFTIFTLIDHALAGDHPRAQHALQSLREEGGEATLILWGIARQLRELHQLQCKHQQGHPYSQILASQWRSKQTLLKSALQRLSLERLNDMLAHLNHVDTIIKGIQNGHAWNELQMLILSMSTGHALHPFEKDDA